MSPDLPPLIDAHVHTDDERLEGDRHAVNRRAQSAGVIAQIVPAISERLWSRVRAVCAEHPSLYACYGLHPCFQDEHRNEHIAQLATWIGRERRVVVGECGLDYFDAGVNKVRQQHMFAAQLSLAREFDLPVVIHARSAVEDVIRMIRVSGHYRGLVHSFNGSIQQAHRLIDLGYLLGFGGAVTYRRAKRLRAMLAALPVDALLLETDAPDQPDALHEGERNEPAHVADICRAIALLRDESAGSLARHTTRNAINLFRLSIALPEMNAEADSRSDALRQPQPV